MRNLIRTFLIILNLIIGCSSPLLAAVYSQKENSDTTFISYPKDQKFLITRQHQYHQTLTIKLFMSQALFDGKLKREDNGKSILYLNYDQALDVIRRIDNLTLGIPKIIYLVGWQYNGHDSKYPAWFEGNKTLKRPGDATSFESLKWLMKEAFKYNTTISLHLNMFDAYKDSPLWDVYLKNDIIAKNADGTLREGEWGYPISYAQEWKTGFAQKRIDSICQLLPLQKAGTVHIDAFHTWPPIPLTDEKGNYHVSLDKSSTSPYLHFTVKDETEAQRNIFKYWASKGIDVTSEGVDFLRETTFEGYQPMAWNFDGGLTNYLKWPASYYCGGKDNSVWGKLFGASMQGEEIVKKDKINLTGFKEDFCLKTVIWYYLNRLTRLYVLNTNEYKAVQFSENVRTFYSKRLYKVTQGNVTLVENDDILIPALWIDGKSLIAYSKNGYKNKTWDLPKGWSNIKTVKIMRITAEDKSDVGIRKIKSGKLTLTLAKDEMMLIERH
jgi:hypothetical protein